MPPASPTLITNSHGSVDSSSGGIGCGFGVQSQRQTNRGGNLWPTAAPRPGSNKPPDKSKMRCSHCGQPRHTYETCFQIHGYPEWWEERQAARAKLAIQINGESGNRSPSTGEAVGRWRTGEGNSRRQTPQPVDAAHEAAPAQKSATLPRKFRRIGMETAEVMG